MTEEAESADLLRAAKDPATPRADLADLAYDHPEVRAAIAANPSTYKGLLDWLRELDDPEINAALDERANLVSTAADAPTVTRVPKAAKTAKSVKVVQPKETSDPAPDATEDAANSAAGTSAVTDTSTVAAAAEPVREPDLATCAACDADLKPTANFCGICGAAVPGRADQVPAQRTNGSSSRPLVYSLVGAAAVVVLMLSGLGVAQAVVSANLQSQALNSSPADGTSGTDNSSGSSSGSNSSSDGSSSSSGDQTNASPSDAATSAPVEAYDFRSNSGNITCEMTPESVVCHQETIQYAMPESACQSGIAGVAVGVDANGAEWPCLDSTIPASTILPYDQPVTQWGFTCSIDYTAGVQCTNSNGNGFTMNYTNGVSTF